MKSNREPRDRMTVGRTKVVPRTLAGAYLANNSVTNCSTDEHNDVDHTFKFAHKTGSENSIEAGFEYEYDSNFLVADAKIKIHAAYGHKWEDEVSVSDETTAHIPGGI